VTAPFWAQESVTLVASVEDQKFPKTTKRDLRRWVRSSGETGFDGGSDRGNPLALYTEAARAVSSTGIAP
jgi:hypothetical protein